MIIRRAAPQDLETIVVLRRERAGWLARRGSDQWSEAGLNDRTFRQRVADSIRAGQTWMVTTEDGHVVGTVAIDHDADPGLWSSVEAAGAVIVHRMIVRLEAAGAGVGKALLDQADRVAQAEGRPWVRLDAWTTNTGLHELYRRHGFRHVRTVEGHHSPSAALFERPVPPPDTASPTAAAEVSAPS